MRVRACACVCVFRGGVCAICIRKLGFLCGGGPSSPGWYLVLCNYLAVCLLFLLEGRRDWNCVLHNITAHQNHRLSVSLASTPHWVSWDADEVGDISENLRMFLFADFSVWFSKKSFSPQNNRDLLYLVELELNAQEIWLKWGTWSKKATKYVH